MGQVKTLKNILAGKAGLLSIAALLLLPLSSPAQGQGDRPSMSEEQFESELKQIAEEMKKPFSGPMGGKEMSRRQARFVDKLMKGLDGIPEEQRSQVLQDLREVSLYMKSLTGDGRLSMQEMRQMMQTFGAAFRDNPDMAHGQMSKRVAQAFDRVLDRTPEFRKEVGGAHGNFGRPGMGGDPSPAAWQAANQAAGGQSAGILTGLAKSLLGAGDDAGALDAAKQAIGLGGKSAEPHALAAQALYNMKDYRTASEAAKEALKLDPKNVQAMAVAKFTAGREGAGNAASPAAEAAAGPAGTRAFGLGGGEAKPALPAGPKETAESVSPARLASLLKDADTRMRQGDPAAALDAARRALKADGRSMDAHILQLKALLRMKRAEEAVAAADEALKLSPGDPRLLTARANAYNLLKKHELGLRDAREAMAFNSTLAEAHVQAAWALDGLGRRGEAMGELAEAARLSAQYRPLLERAKALKDGELAAMLAGEMAELIPRKEASREASLFTRRRAVTMSLAMAVGAVLIVWGLLQVGSGEWKDRLAGLFSGRTSPGVEEFPPESLPPDGDPTGRRIAGGYQVVRKLGLGGMGVVYEALDTTLERRVAVKRMREEIRMDPAKRERFLSEARMVAALHHPNIVDIYQVVEEGSDAYLVFEYVDGKTLGEVLRERGRLSFDEAMGVVSGASAALEYAHSKGVIHRDLKPSNVMVNKDRLIKLMDFGVARQDKDFYGRASADQGAAGTPSYMAPEQENGADCRETDVYSLGVCLYEMLAGEPPFSGSPAGMALAKLNKTYAAVSTKAPGLPAGFDAVLDKALDPDPAKRWRSAREFYAALKSVAK